MANLIIVLALLAATMAVSLIHWWKKRLAQRETQRSNARVLREFKRIAVRQPDRIHERQE